MFKIQSLQAYTDNELKEAGTWIIIRNGTEIDLKDGEIKRNDIYYVYEERARVILGRNLAVLLEIKKEVKKNVKKT